MQVKPISTGESHKSLFSDPLATQIKGIILNKPQIPSHHLFQPEDPTYDHLLPKQPRSPQLTTPYQYQRECDRLRDHITEMKLDFAQAQSDKIELMRDLATYQSEVCQAISIEQKMSAMRELTLKTLEKCKGMGVESDMFQDKLFEIVDNGITRQNAKMCMLKYTKDLIQKRKQLKKQRLIKNHPTENLLSNKKYSNESLGVYPSKNSLGQDIGPILCY